MNYKDPPRYIFISCLGDEIAVFSQFQTATLNVFRFLVSDARKNIDHIQESLDFRKYETAFVERRSLCKETDLFVHDMYITFEGLDLLMDEHCDDLGGFIESTWSALNKGIIPKELLELCDDLPNEYSSAFYDGSDGDSTEVAFGRLSSSNTPCTSGNSSD